MDSKHRDILFYGIGFVLILLAGFREIGFDPDSDVYDGYYRNYYNITLLDSVEYSFILLAQFFNIFSKDIHILFLFYAFWGVLLKFVAFRKYSDSLFMLTLMYISYFYEMHETCQIRTGVLSGFFLLAVPLIADGHRMKAFWLLVLGTFFHVSGLALFPIVFLNNREFNIKRALFWGSLIPLSYVAVKLIGSVLLTMDIPYIGVKIETYQEAEDTGQRFVSGLNVYSPLQIFSILLFYYLLFFFRTITEKCKYFPLLMKINAAGMFFFVSLSFLPVLGERVGWLYRTVTVILLPCIYYTIKPRWCGILMVILVAFVYFNYILRSMYEFTFILTR